MQGIEAHSSDDGSWIEARSSKKRRKGGVGSGASSETMISNIANTALPEGLRFVFVPLTAGQKVTELSSTIVSQALQKHCPEGILEVRYNIRINLIAVDKQNSMSTRTLKFTEICGVPIRAYEPYSKPVISGVIKKVENGL